MSLFTRPDPQLENLRDRITEEAEALYKDIIANFHQDRSHMHWQVRPSHGAAMTVMLKKIYAPEVKSYQAHLEDYRGNKIIQGRMKGSKWDVLVSLRNRIYEAREDEKRRMAEEREGEEADRDRRRTNRMWQAVEERWDRK